MLDLLSEDDLNKMRQDLVKARLSDEDRDDDSVRQLIDESNIAMRVNPELAATYESRRQGSSGGSSFGGSTSSPSSERFELLKELSEGAIKPQTTPFEVTLPPLPEVVTGNNAAEITSKDTHAVAVARRHITYNLAKQERGEDAFFNSMQQWYNEKFHKDKLLTPEEATNKYRSAGLDIKAAKPLSQQSVDRAIRVESSRIAYTQLLNDNMRGGDVGTWNNMLMLGSALMGYVGPVEIGANVVLGAVAPGLAVKLVAGGANLARMALRLKTIKDATATLNVLRNAESMAVVARAVNPVNKVGSVSTAVTNISKADVAGAAAKIRTAATAAGGADRVALSSSVFQDGVAKNALNELGNAQRMGKISTPDVYERLVNARTVEEARAILQDASATERGLFVENRALMTELDTLSGMSYNSLGIRAKTLADMSAMPVTDMPFIQSKYADSQALGLGYYSERDRMAESLMAAFAAPAILMPARYIGSKFIAPHAALFMGRVNKLFRDVDIQEALGTISHAEAEAKRVDLKDVFINTVKGEVETGTILKPSKVIKEMVEDMEGMNLDSESAVAVTQYVAGCMETGAKIDLSELPGNVKMMLSSVDARIISEGVRSGFENVFKDSMVKTVSEKTGLTSIEITSEGGLLKGYKIWGLDEQEAIDNLNDLYKGYVAGDEQAKARFVERARRMSKFIEDGRELLRVDEEMHDINARVKKGALPETEKIGFIEQRLTRKNSLMNMFLDKQYPGLREAYPTSVLVEKNKLDPLTYKGFATEEDELNAYSEMSRGIFDDTNDINKYQKDVLVTADELNASPGSPVDYKSYEKVLQDRINIVKSAVADADAFSRRFHNRGTVDTGKVRFEQLQPNFQEYLDELAGAMEDMTYLANVSDYAEQVGSEKMARLAVKMSNGGFTPDEFNGLLLGARRITSEEFADSAREATVKRGLLAESRLDMAKMKKDESLTDVFSSLEKDSAVDSKAGSFYTQAVDRVEAANKLLKTGFSEVEGELYEELTVKNESFQKVLNYFDLDNITPRNARAVGAFLQKSIINVLSRHPEMTKVLSKNDIKVLAGEVSRNLKKVLQDNPDMVGALMSEENRLIKSGMGRKNRVVMSEGKTTEEMTSGLQKDSGMLRTTAEYAVAWKKFYTMFEDVISSRVMDVELQEANNIKIAVKTTKLMRDMPEVAGEILTGLATQTVYSYLGSRASVESASKAASMYITEFYSDLKKAKSTDGLSLYDWAVMPENKNEIFEMRSRILRGEVINDKGNAYQVAKGMVDMESTIKQLFRRYGADYRSYTETVKRAKLRYADSAILPAEREQIVNNINTSARNLDADRLIQQVGVDDAGMFTYGNKVGFASSGDESYKEIQKTINTINHELELLVGTGDEPNNAVTMWMFKVLDLDAMWDRDAHRLISLNSIRDVLLDGGNLVDLIGNDAYDIKELAEGIKTIRTIFRGKLVKTKGGTETYVTQGAADEFISGFFDLRATPTGGQVASTRLLTNQLVFKNIEEEVDAMSRFGYDSLDEYLRTYISNITSSLSVLEKMGSSPLTLVDTLIATHNNAIKNDPKLIAKLKLRRETAFGGGEAGKKAASKYLSKMGISNGAAKSIRANVQLACGLDNYTPSAPVQVVNIFKTIASSPLLVSAGLKSFSDVGSTVTGLLMNGMAESPVDAWRTVLNFLRVIQTNKDIRNLHYGSTVLTGMQLFKAYGGDPIGAAYMSSIQHGRLDKAEAFANKFGDMVMNALGRLESVTNITKQTAAWSIGYTVGRNADKKFSQLSTKLQSAWAREGLVADDWEFIRANGISTMYDLASEVGAKAGKDMNNYGVLDVYKLMNLDDSVYIKEMERRGMEVITSDTLAAFKHGITSKVWAMLDSGSDEMISIPSGRIQTILHGYYPKNSGIATALNLATQYQSFGASLLYNNYIKYLAYQTEGETGITVVDLFNPAARLTRHTRSDVFKGLAGVWFNLAMAMLVVETAVNAMKGQIQKPIDEHGIHADLLGTTLLGSIGIMGTALESAWGGLETSGQRRGGGISLNIAPSLSNAGRFFGHVGRPLFSSRVPQDKKGEAVTAGFANELGRFTGLKTSPFTAIIWQSMFGSMLDEMYYGGRRGHNTYLNQRERRGYWVPEYERFPGTGFEFLNGD